MRSIRNYLILSLAIIGFSVFGISGETLPAGKPQARTIEQQIYKKLLGLPNYGVFDHISVQVNGGNVILSGKVLSLGTKRMAAAVVKDIPGVASVVNNIQDLPPSPYDDRIRRQALATFSAHGLSGYFWETRPEVRIIVEDGRLTLEGNVYSSGDRNAMNMLAHGITGIFDVQNNLKVGQDADR